MSGLIPRPFIDELLARTDIIDLIDAYVPLKKRGASFIACCPFHNEKTPSFNVNAQKQFYHCFGCGESGNAISFVMRYLNLDFVLAIENLAQRLGLDVPKESGVKTQIKERAQKLAPILEEVAKFYQNELKSNQEAIYYLKDRGITGETAKNYHLGFAPEGWHNLEPQFKNQQVALYETGMLIKNDKGHFYDRYRQRIMFPIHNRKGEIVGFGGRSIHKDQTPKYLNSPETPLFQKSKELYGLYQILAKKEPIDTLFVVEGYIDVIALAQYGLHQAVATLGTATSSFHIQVLLKYCSKIIFCFDGDNAGRKAAWKALEVSLPYLNQGLEAKFMFLPEGEDPDSLVRTQGKSGFLSLAQNAQSMENFLISHLSQGLDLKLLAHKNQLLRQALPYLENIGPGPYQDLMINQLSRLTYLESQQIIKHLKNPLNIAPSVSTNTLVRTPQRIAIALLLQNPSLYIHISTLLPPHYFKEVHPFILSEMMQALIEHPDAHCASLIERFRDSRWFNILSELLVWDHQVPEAFLAREFLDTLKFLLKQKRDQNISDLLTKSRQQGLSDPEKETLQTLLKEKHHAG